MSELKMNEINFYDCIGQSVEFLAVISREEMKKTKAGNPYLEMSVVCGNVAQTIRFWDLKQPSETVGRVALIGCKVSEWRDAPSLDGASLSVLDMSTIDFLIGDQDRTQTLADFETLLNSFDNPDGFYARVCFDILEKVFADFVLAPAGKSFHHAYIGGLVQHTVEVAKVALSLLNNDLVRASALLHDVGKVKELEVNTVTGDIKYTALGSLIGHHSIGCSMIDEAVMDLYDHNRFLWSEKAMLLKHVLLSHHGTREMGSSVTPAVEEAYVVHQADMLSCRRFKQENNTKLLADGEIVSLFEGGSLQSYYKAGDYKAGE